MKLYLIGGLGADERVFEHLMLDADCTVIKWLSPHQSEALDSYVCRLSEQVDTSVPFGIVGVSFGGIVAMELAKLLKPKVVFLVSSVMFSSQLPRFYVSIGRLGLLKLIPLRLIKPPNFVFHYLFGAKDKMLLDAIVSDTDPRFIKWALQSIIDWHNDTLPISDIVRIHGDKDRVIPLKGGAVLVKNGGHFMVVDRAAEVSNFINHTL